MMTVVSRFLIMAVQNKIEKELRSIQILPVKNARKQKLEKIATKNKKYINRNMQGGRWRRQEKTKTCIF